MRHLKTGEDKTFVQAIQGTRLSREPQEAVKQLLRGIMVRLGIRAANMPTDEEKAILLHHIATHYGNHTLTEINLAFEMAMAGKLDCEVNCYENFSCLYFSGIMNAYRRWAKEAYKELPAPAPKELPAAPLSEADRQDWINEWKNKPDIQMELIPVFFYDYLQLTNYSDYLTRAFEFCKLKISDENIPAPLKLLRMAEFNRQETEGFEGEFKTMIVNTAKKMAVFHKLKS